MKLLENRFDELEQRDKANNIVVVGVPKQNDQSTKNIMKNILETMQITCNENDIVESYRLDKKEDGPILVKFRNFDLKKSVLKRVREVRRITVEKCVMQENDRKIYLNDDMTLQKRLLFKKAREVKEKKVIRQSTF